jgi:hypothetical protein
VDINDYIYYVNKQLTNLTISYMKKKIGKFTVNADGNSGLITVYKGNDMMKGVAVAPAQLEEKFKAMCDQVEEHVAKSFKTKK